MFKLYILCLSVIVSSCSKDTFPKYGVLGDLRVLTIVATADQGEVNPGASVTLQPVISDLNGGGRNLNVAIQACVDPGISLGAPPVCPHPDSTSSSSFSTTTLSANGTFTGAAPTFSIAIPATPAGFAFAPANIKYNGIAYLVLYTVSAADGASTTAFKRIVISDPGKAAKNKNPAIASVAANGVPLAATSAYTGAVVDLGVNFTLGAESYQLMNADGSLTTNQESLTTTWFYTDGTMKYQRTTSTDTNHWEPSKPPSRGVTLVVVTHDGRGGEDFKQFDFN